MKLVVAGEYQFSMYQDALLYGVQKLGHEGVKLRLKNGRLFDIYLLIKNSVLLVRKVQKERPDVLFLYRVENLAAFTLKLLKWKYPTLCIMLYHNDDPFRNLFIRRMKSIHYLNCIKYADLVYVYRQVNISEAKQLGAPMAKLYMSHYDSRYDLKEYTEKDFCKQTDRVVFVGHYEDDDRAEYLDLLYKNAINLHVYGPDTWKVIFSQRGWPTSHLHGLVMKDEYRKIIHEASIALAFFSKANRDEYTRRCFEIPVMGTMLLAPRTALTEKLFDDNENAVLYSDKEDFLKKVIFYSEHPELRDSIAENGYKHIIGGEHSETARARMVVDDAFNWGVSH